MDSVSREHPDSSDGVLRSALQVGAGAGVIGFLVGGTAGILRSTTPTLFAATSSLQWALLGSTFWAARGAFLQTRVPERVTPRDQVYATALGGALAGAISASVFRRRSNIIPAAVTFSLVALAGQSTYSAWEKRQRNTDVSSAENRPNIVQRVASSRWSPMTVLSDEEYTAMLNEKLLKVDAEIALIDEDIDRLKQGAQDPPKESHE